MLGYLIQGLHHLQLDKNKISKKADAKLQLVTSQRLDYLILLDSSVLQVLH